MTTSGLSVSLPTESGTPRIAWANMFVNLLRKELRESAGLLIAGLAIYWIMPAILEFVYIAVDPRHEWVSGGAVAFIQLTGWAYAIVVGAQTVCRDWGRDEERFLLAQPISPHIVVAAKLVAGFAVLLFVFFIGFAWDVMMDQFMPETSGGPRLLHDENVRVAILVACVLLAAFSIAFGVAVATRQMLPSVLVSGLILLIWAVAPLVSGSLAVLHPYEVASGIKNTLTGNHVVPAQPPPNTGFYMAIGLCSAGAIFAAFLASTRERVIRLGHKPLAWTIAGATLLLFTMGLNEVGNALPIREQQLFVPSDWDSDYPYWAKASARAVQGDRIVVINAAWKSWDGPQPEHEGEIYGTSCDDIVEFRVDEEGRIRDARQAILGRIVYGKDEPAETPDVINLILNTVASSPLLLPEESPDEMVFGGFAKGFACRVRLRWPQGEDPRVVSESSVKLPHDRRQCWGRQHLMTPRYSYITYTETSEPRVEGTVLSLDKTSGHILVIDWAKEQNPRVVQSFPVPAETIIELSHGYLVLKCPSFGSENMSSVSNWTITAIPADDLDTLASLQTVQLVRPRGIHSWERHDRNVLKCSTGLFRRTYGDDAEPTCVIGGDKRLIVNDELGIRIFDMSEPPRMQLLGEYRRSPLSMLVSSYGGPSRYFGMSGMLRWAMPQLVGDSLYIEPGMTTFDVSDPGRPRRSGFIMGDFFAQILATPRHIVIAQGPLVTVVDRPDQ